MPASANAVFPAFAGPPNLWLNWARNAARLSLSSNGGVITRCAGTLPLRSRAALYWSIR